MVRRTSSYTHLAACDRTYQLSLLIVFPFHPLCQFGMITIGMMKWIICFVLLLYPLTTVHAITEAFTVNGKEYSIDFAADEVTLGSCDGGPALDGEVCNQNGSRSNPPIIPNQTKKFCNWNEELRKLECHSTNTHVVSDTITWGNKPAGNYKLGPLAGILDAARLAFTPKIVLDNTVHNTNPQWSTWIARACDFKRQDNEPWEYVPKSDDISRERMQLGPDPNLPIAVEHLAYYKTTFSTASKLEQYYQRAIEKVKKASAYPCGYLSKATLVGKSVKESQGQGIWDILTIIFHLKIQELWSHSDTERRIYETERMPYNEEIAGGMIQADERVFEFSRISQIYKDKIAQDAGLLETFRPCAMSFEPSEYTGELDNEYMFVGGDTFPQKSRQANTNLIESTKNFFETVLLPKALQKKSMKLASRPCDTPVTTTNYITDLLPCQTCMVNKLTIIS